MEMDLYPGFLVIGTLVISFTFFTLIMLGWCLDINHIRSLPTTVLSFDDKFSPCMSLESHSITFHYKAAEGTNQTECVICLTSFEEEESVRKLHTCKHIFHTFCINKWLGSHSGCPLCRTQIDKVNSQNSRVALEENDHMIMVIVNS
ncbi:hypothetical protein VNO80_00377 [Phaseolus coccineus]|uniref:RING-type domain-containing protein n=1 Tax=Phaseolus coccineus TaxID=3886 RepID=A0AAN9RQT6_PHACN